jgi:phage shock protein E
MRKPKRQQKTFGRWNLLIAAGVVVTIVIAGLAIVLPNSPANASGYPAQISVAEAAAKRDAGAFVLDVRTPQEWEEYHVAGSTLIPLDELQSRISEVPRDQEVVVVCHSGNRSAKARDLLRQAGLAQVTSMAGGLTEWKAQGYPTVTGS